jgi:hypothetical protein
MVNNMKDYERYKIKVGQIYKPADGSYNRLTVEDVTTYADCGDVIVFDMLADVSRRIDAFKLSVVRYYLAEEEDGTV